LLLEVVVVVVVQRAVMLALAEVVELVETMVRLAVL
jgi:hypothetical protein